MSHPHLAKHDTSVLVLVDFQEPFAQAMPQRAEIANNIIALINIATLVDMPVIVTEQTPEKLGHTADDVKPILLEKNVYKPLTKTAFSCYRSAEFVQTVYDLGRDTIILVGLEGHVCIQQTALDAMSLGYKAHIVIDAVASRRPHDLTAAHDKMRTAGAILTTTEMLAYELLEEGGTKEFKTAMQWLKW